MSRSYKSLCTFCNLHKTIEKYWQGKTNSCQLSLNRMKSDNKNMGVKNESMTEGITSASAAPSHVRDTSSNYTQLNNTHLHDKQLVRKQVKIVVLDNVYLNNSIYDLFDLLSNNQEFSNYIYKCF